MFIERFFKLRDNGTTIRTEILGGATTFVTMAYIIVVNPAILSFAGIPAGPSTVATILAAVFGTMLMGLWANRPLAVAPYMGENAFIAFGLAAMGIGWQLRLGAVFISGLAFALITLFRIRSWLANSISASLKHSFAVGIGLFLAFIGLYETGIVTSAVAGMPPQALIHGGAAVLSAPACAFENRRSSLNAGPSGTVRFLLYQHADVLPRPRRNYAGHCGHGRSGIFNRTRRGPQSRHGHSLCRRI